MPRVAPLHIAALEDLVDQLRFAPRRTIVRQLERAEALAEELQPEQVYPEDWLIFRITSYRPDLDAPAMFAGEALIRELSSFVERLSDEARLTFDDLHGSVHDIHALCARWSVSRRTVERYRRRGLIAHRVRDAHNNTHLAFRESAVNAFEVTHADLLQRAGAFSRSSDDTRAQIIEAARELRRTQHLSLQEAAERLGARFSRGRETIRRLLIEHDESTERPIFEVVSPLTGQQRRLIFRAWQWGVAPSAMAQRYERSVATVHRVINERRAELLRRLNLGDPSTAADVMIMTDVLESPVACSGLAEDPELDVHQFVSAAHGAPPADQHRLMQLGTAHRFLRGRALSAIAELPRYNAPASQLDAIETDLRWATLIKQLLVESQGTLIVRSVEERLGRSILDLAASDIVMVLLRAIDATSEGVEHFDPTRGGRLAAPVSLALGRALARLQVDTSRPVQARSTTLRLPNWTRRLDPWQAWLDPDPRLRQSIELLDEPGRDAIEARFGWHGRPPMTLAQLHEKLGVSANRFAAIRRHALTMMRFHAALPGTAGDQQPP